MMKSYNYFIREYHSKQLAPNGKPSNLSPELYELIRTDEFKNWFGDWENNPENSSKVIDENGEPKLVYHGSSEDFDKFDKEFLGACCNAKSAKMAFFFTDDKKFAKEYSNRFAGGKLFRVFLDIKNPVVKDFKGRNVNPDKILVDMLNEGGDGIIALNFVDGFQISNQYAVKEPEKIYIVYKK